MHGSNLRSQIIKRLSYLFTMLVGAGAMLGAINPPQFLQDIIVYTGSGLAAWYLLSGDADQGSAEPSRD